MVWKIRRSSREGSNSPSSSVNSTSHQDANPIKAQSAKKSCLKKSQDQTDQSSVDSSNPSGDQSRSTATKSVGSRSHGSRSRFSFSSREKEGPALDQGSIRSDGSLSATPSATSVTPSKDVSKDHSSVSLRSSGSSARSQRKRVKFNDVQVREYERVVGDNPSCSSGPPVGIGWAHSDTETIKVDLFEGKRMYRSMNEARMVLSREEREELLLAWGASLHDMIDAIRTNIRVKNQRRQTVTNLGKVEKIEEAFETATRKLKKAIGLRRSTEKKVKALQEQAKLARNALESLKLAETEALNELRAKEIPEETEPENDDLENLEVEVAVSDYCQYTPAESKLVRSSSSLSAKDDLTLSGSTIGGNSTTASVLEMERFYRELEMEMFGDELPSMVGQTLEVPCAEIPEEDRYYDDVESVSGFQEPLSVAPTMDGDEEDQQGEDKDYDESPPGSHFISHSEVNVYLKSAHARRLANEHFESQVKTDCSGDQSQLPQFHHVPPHMGYYARRDHPPANFCTHGARISSSVGAADVDCLHESRMTPEQPHFMYPPHIIPPPMGYPYNNYSTPYGYAPQWSATWLQSTRRSRDSPEIRHIPPPTHLSPTQWMEHCSDSHPVRPSFDPVVISEDGCDLGDDFQPGCNQMNYGEREPGWDYQPPMQFAASFY